MYKTNNTQSKIFCRSLPCGVATVNPAFNTPTKTNPDDEDVLYSVSQRYAYTDPRNTKKKNVQIPSKYKNNKMTVRLRPRQVLCSKCKGICNENSENVSRKRKPSESVQPVPPIKRGANAPVTRSVNTELNSRKKPEVKATLVPKIARLLPQEISNALSGNVNKLNIIDNVKKQSPVSSSAVKCASDADTENTPAEQIVHSTDHSDSSTTATEIDHPPDITAKSTKRILRKKRSILSMEDLWDESVFEENVHGKNNNSNTQSDANNAEQSQNVCTSTRTLKISYGPQGEGTILKIPRIENLTLDEVDESVDADAEDEKTRTKDSNDKAARRALKRAKKEAKRKVLLSGSSPCYLGNGSPRYSVAGSSPRYTVGSASPRHGLGSNSPRYVAASVYEINAPRRRKHKMKHKKKHREDKGRKHKESEVSVDDVDVVVG